MRDSGRTPLASRWTSHPLAAPPEPSPTSRCKLFATFGLQRGTFLQRFGPAVWLHGLRAVLKGHGVGAPRGDPLQVPGAFVVRDGEVPWSHRANHAGDQPRLRDVIEVIRGA